MIGQPNGKYSNNDIVFLAIVTTNWSVEGFGEKRRNLIFDEPVDSENAKLKINKNYRFHVKIFYQLLTET